MKVGGHLVTFGPFEWDEGGRLLLENGIPVRIGDRLLDLLAILLEQPGRLVPQVELISRAWPAGGTDAANLRAHMSALRKILGDGRSGARYISNEHGRGYGFVAFLGKPIARNAVETPPPIRHSFPLQVIHPVGRKSLIGDISVALEDQRLVTLVGSGGVGKSTVAFAVAERRHADAVQFVDMSVLSDGASVVPHLAMTLGLGKVTSANELAVLLLRSKPMLLLLDNCDRVIDATARLVEAVLSVAPSLRIMATSREPLRASGERVFRLAGLDLPQIDSLTAKEASRFPAVQLFIERAAASSPGFTVSEREIPELIKLCRRLDGIPLAIELAAAHVDLLGLREMSSAMDARSILHAQGRRTAVARHKTLLALLDWSFDALSSEEKHVLANISVFKGGFGLDAAIMVASDHRVSSEDVTLALASLTAKSLVNVDFNKGIAHYRQSEITRTYASGKFASERLRHETNRRHARYFTNLMRSAPDDLLRMETSAWSKYYGPYVGDVLSALEWAFSPVGDIDIAAALTVVSAPFAQIFGLFGEYRARFYQAIERIRDIDHEASPDNLALGISLNFELTQIGETAGFQGARRAARELYERTGAETPEGSYSEWAEAFLEGNYPAASIAAEKLSSLADRLDSEAFRVAALRLKAQTLHFEGRQAEAKHAALSVLESPFEYLPLSKISHKVSMRIILARIAYLEGDNEAAYELSEDVVERAREQNPSSLCHALTIAAIPIALWCGLLDQAEPLVEMALAVAIQNQNAYWAQLAANLGDAVSYMRGRFVASSFGTLVDEDDALRNVKMSDMLPTFDERFLSASALRRVETGVSGWNAPEILRIKAMRVGKTNRAEAFSLFTKAVRLAEEQGAVAWIKRIEHSRFGMIAK